MDFSEPSIPVKCFGPITATNDLTSNSKIRLAPLEAPQQPLILAKEQDRPASWVQPQQPASPLSITTESDSLSFGLLTEFDQLFSGEDVSMFSLLDHDDLIREIEAAFPDDFQDNPEEDGPVGSESDPSGDTTEEEEKGEQQKTSLKSVEEPSTTETAPPKLTMPNFPRNRPPRVTRYLSEPRL